MKKNNLFYLLGAGIIILGSSLTLLSPCDSPLVGDHSGAPGEGNCSACHSSPVNPDIPDLHFEAGNNDSVYVPGNTYLVHIKIKRSGHNKFGFVCSSLDTNNNSKGAFGLINTAITRTYTLGGRNYVSHTPCGADSQDSMTWTYNWTAPVTNAGKIKIYMSMLVANHDEALTGDTTYTRILTLTPSINNAVENLKAGSAAMIYPTPFNDAFQIDFSSENIGQIKQVLLYSSTGKLIDSFETNSNKITHSLNPNLPSGLYFVRIVCAKKTQVLKIIKQ